MTNPKQTSGQSGADARSITEQDINRRIADALGYIVEEDSKPRVQGAVVFREWGRSKSYEIDWLNDKEEFCRLLMDNWEGIAAKLDEWFTYCDDIGGLTESLEWLWWEHSEYLANKELWILRALVAYKESLK